MILKIAGISIHAAQDLTSGLPLSDRRQDRVGHITEWFAETLILCR